MSDDRQLCTFFVGGMFYGIEVVRVQEVIRYQEMTRVPLAPAEVSGLINLREQIVTAIDARKRLGFPDRPEGQLPMNVVVQVDEGAASLLVDDIGDVIEVSRSLFEVVPETVPIATRQVLRGVYKVEGRLLLEVDADRLLGNAGNAGSLAAATHPPGADAGIRAN